MEYCKWCGRELHGWYLTYKGMTFCDDKDEMCIKNYLREKHDLDIDSEIAEDSEYSMQEVCERD